MLSSNGYMAQNVGWKEKNPEDVSYFIYFQRIHQNFQVVEEISGNREADVLQNLWVIKKKLKNLWVTKKNASVRKGNQNLFKLILMKSLGYYFPGLHSQDQDSLSLPFVQIKSCSIQAQKYQLKPLGKGHFRSRELCQHL